MDNMSKLRLTREIWSFVKPYKLAFINLFFCIILTSFIGMLYPYIFKMLIDEVFYHHNAAFFVTIVLSYGAIFVGEQSLHFILNITWSYLSTRFLFDIRRKMFQKIFQMKAEFLNRSQTGDLATKINYDTELILKYIHSNIFGSFADIVRIVVSVIMVAVINYKLAILMLFVTPTSVYLSRFFAGRLKLYVQNERDTYGKHISWLFEMLEGMAEIRLMAAERPIVKQFVKGWSKLIRTRNASKMIEVGAERSNSFVMLLTNLILYAVAGLLIINGELTVGGFIALIDYFSVCTNRLKGLNETIVKVQQNMVSIKKVFDLLLHDAVEKDNSNLIDIEISQGSILFENVTFGYDNHNVLNELSLEIKTGEKLAIVGKSGAGKSTLVNLLLRFYDWTEGSIRINGTDIRKCPLRSLRRSIGIVQQDTVIFDGSFSSNLKLGRPDCTDEEILEACDRAHIGDFIRSLPNGLETIVGTDGIDLSGGQRQRLSIARIFLKNPRIVIFDESTSALDYEAEQIIKNSWKELCDGRTAIIIAHRLSTFIDSDRVAVLHEGKITACDHHSVLLKTSDQYQKLYREQYGQEGKAV